MDDENDEGVEKKEKGGRAGTKAKETKKRGNHIRFVPPSPSRIPTNLFHRKTSTDKAQEEAAMKAAAKAHK